MTHNSGISILSKGLALTCGAFFVCLSQAAGPAKMALIDRAIYQASINTPAGFDQASRLEILAFVHALDAIPSLSELEGPARSSAERWRELTLQRLVGNWRLARAGCTAKEALYCDGAVNNSAELIALARRFTERLPATLTPWAAAAQAFHAAYAAEQQRLAAYFPKISSEVLSYGDAERNGFELPDRNFMLSFDDGPTAAGGNTDALIARLQELDLHAQFFMLGENLNKRRGKTGIEKMRALYSGQCVAAHGYTHKSHQKMTDWHESINATLKQLDEIFGVAKVHYFRPPYAQRVPEAAEVLGKENTRIILWNLDSQDWSSKMPTERVSDRMLTLMLLWRRGMLLFHDIHPKAQAALPVMLKALEGSGIQWMDCREYR